MSGEDFNNFSLAVLRLQTLERLSHSLNPKKLLRSVDGRLRDWSGLADLAKLSPEEKLKVESAYKKDHTRAIIAIWCNRSGVTVQHLVTALEFMDRHDTVQDVRPLLLKDCREAAAVAMTGVAAPHIDKTNALTLQDVEALASGKPLTKYDAMVLFGESDEDIGFGSHLIERCEDAGLKMFVPQRDLVAGTIEHETSSKIISERCRKVIAVFSPTFLESERNMFLTGFAQHAGIMDGRNDKIIPIILRPCALPVQYQMYHKVVYDPRRKYVNFWDKILRVTFDLKDVPDSLKEYKFFLSSDSNSTEDSSSRHAFAKSSTSPVPSLTQPPVPRQQLTNIGTGRSSSTLNQDDDGISLNTEYFGTDSVITTDTALSVARLVDVGGGENNTRSGNLAEMLPNPPSEDPNSDSASKSQMKPKSKIKQFKDKFRRSKSKKEAEALN